MAYLSDMVVEQATSQPDAEAVVFEETRLSYGQLNERVNRLANGLRSLGLREGSHVALVMENCHQYLEAYYALSKAGMVAVPLNWRLSDEELRYIVDHSDTKFLFGEGQEEVDKALSIIDDDPVLDEDLLELLCWASRYYQHPIGEVIAASQNNYEKSGLAAATGYVFQVRSVDHDANESSAATMTKKLKARNN